MFVIRALVAIILLFAAPAGAIAQEAVPDTNVVELTILRDGNVVATPKLIMQVGSAAVLTVTGAGGYSVKGSLEPDTRLTNGRKVDLELYFADQDQWVLAGKPSISTELNRSGQMSFSDKTGRMLEIRATVSDTFSGDISMQSWGKNKCSARKLALWQDAMRLPVSAGLIKVQRSPRGKCCSSGNMSCCSDGPACCSDGNGHSCCN